MAEDALGLVAEGQARGVPIRLLGGMAVYLSSPHAREGPLARPYGDLDVVSYSRRTQALKEVFEARGFTANARFNSLHGAQRMMFYHHDPDYPVDVFLDTFSMCHKLPLLGRLEASSVTLPLADLLLTKLQVVQINEKDLQDLVALLIDHEVAEEGDEGEVIRLPRVVGLLSADWGFATTCGDNLEHVVTRAREWLAPADAAVVEGRVRALQQALEQAPKSMAYRLRARVGRRVPWYELPEEVAK